MKHKLIGIFASCVVLSSLIFLFYIIGLNHVDKIESVPEANTTSEQCSIENVSYLKKSVSISGFAVNKGVVNKGHNWILGDFTAVYINNSIVLVDENNNQIKLHTVAVERPEISKSMGDGINYGRCGITAKVAYSSLCKGHVYRVAVLAEDKSGNKELIYSDKEVKI